MVDMDNNTALLMQYKNGDKDARKRLCEDNMGLVRKIAGRFITSGVDEEDLVQTGAMGLLKAIDNFDDSFGVKLSTYAVPMIIGEIRRFLRDDGIIKVSRSLKQAAYNGYKARSELSIQMNREPTISEISEFSGIPTETLIEAFDATNPPDSINREMYDDSDEELSSYISAGNEEEKIINKIAVREILDKLKPRERQILVLRYFKGKTQKEISQVVGVSQVQVSRIEKKVIDGLRGTEMY